jgi:hypothetical protein
MEKKYWVTEQGTLMSTSSNWTVKNGKVISKAKFYQMLKEQKRFNNELNETGFAMKDNVLYMKF